MVKLPRKYKWLESTKELPWVIVQGLKEFGTWEYAKEEDNPKIVGWADEVGSWEKTIYTKDSIPWCGLFVAVICKRAKKKVVKNYLRALSWASFGKDIPTDEAGLGDVLTFTRKGGGHVGFYIAEDDTAYHVLGGNQGDQVNIKRIAKSRVYSVNRPKYNNTPKSVKKYFMDAKGVLSDNEQ